VMMELLKFGISFEHKRMLKNYKGTVKKFGHCARFQIVGSNYVLMWIFNLEIMGFLAGVEMGRLFTGWKNT